MLEISQLSQLSIYIFFFWGGLVWFFRPKGDSPPYSHYGQEMIVINIFLIPLDSKIDQLTIRYTYPICEVNPPIEATVN
jgi:hypothetical protein